MNHKFAKLALTGFAALTLLACSLFTPAAPTPSAADIEKEEQAVYSFFVNGNPALILQNTSTDIAQDDPKQMVDYIKTGLKNVTDETVDNFLERNAQPSQLSPDMDLGVDYVLLTEEELAQISSQPNWGEVLSQKYPGANGYTIFSRVGFNNTLDQALIYVGNVGGPLMGSGSYFLMEKQNGEWVIKEEIMVWIS